MKTIRVKILDRRFYSFFSFPQYATFGSAGLDLLACINHMVAIYPGETRLISTGIAIYIANRRIAGMILPRSGLGHNYNIVLGNLVGLIDSDYQGELKVSLWNRGDQVFIITPGKRIAQLIFISIFQVKFSVVSEFKISDRGSSGFGHSG